MNYKIFRKKFIFHYFDLNVFTNDKGFTVVTVTLQLPICGLVIVMSQSLQTLLSGPASGGKSGKIVKEIMECVYCLIKVSGKNQGF